MAKLTLMFKGHTLSTQPVDDQPLLVGRDPDCQLRIDSLAVAPKHALISPNEDTYTVKALDSKHPVRINMAPIGEPRRLKHGDVLQIGKHTLIFSSDPAGITPPQTFAEPAADIGKDRRDNSTQESLGYLQIQSGGDLGKILTFRRAVTRLTRLGADHVIVTRNGDTLNLSLLTEASEASIDGIDVEHGIEVPLRDGSVIEVNGVRCRFFCGQEVHLDTHADL